MWRAGCSTPGTATERDCVPINDSQYLSMSPALHTALPANALTALWPAIALVAWTFAVLLCIPVARIRAVLRGRVRAEDFKLGESAAVPSDVRVFNRNYMNLLELPVLFYAASLSVCLMGGASALQLGLAWAYVGLRVLHSLIHLSYNHVIHRLLAFALSNAVLLALWVLLALQLHTLGLAVTAA